MAEHHIPHAAGGPHAAPGSEWSETIQENLRGADLIVFLISRAFLKSKYIADVVTEVGSSTMK